MTIHSPLFLLAALGLLSAAGPAAAVDTSAWTCETCPYPKGTSASIDVGVGHVSKDAAKFGDHTGLDKQGAHLVLGGTLSHRGADGYFADLAASDLGLDSRALRLRSGREGLYSLRLNYAELPRSLADGAHTPFLGSGGQVLTLPAGYPAAGTATMPLATTLQPLDLAYKRTQFGLTGQTTALDDWTLRLSYRRDVRDGTQPGSAAFYSSVSQLAFPVDQTTDQFELGAAYGRGPLQASLGWQVSKFKNGADALTWDNPYWPVVAGATRGQLALAPDNTLQQITGSASYQIAPNIRASADVAWGHLTQDAAFLPTTLNATLAGAATALPATSLNGKVDTFNANLRLSATVLDGLRLNASYARNVRDNQTVVRSYTQVSSDIFLDALQRSNTPFDVYQDRYKLSADYRTANDVKLSAGVEQDSRQRTYTEVVSTREATVWGRVAHQFSDEVSASLKLAHAQRKHSDYGVATWFGAPENPLLRKYNLAERRRDSASLRLDLTPSETLGLGLSMDYANDDYLKSAVGLNVGRSYSLGADASWAYSDQTKLTAYTQAEWITSRQSGSQAYAAPDWKALNRDRFQILGVGVTHALIVDKLDIGADFTLTRSHGEISLSPAGSAPAFPAATTATDTFKLHASYKLQDNLSLNGSLWYERNHAADWRLDGIQPASVPNLLAFGQQAPHYEVAVIRMSVRYRF